MKSKKKTKKVIKKKVKVYPFSKLPPDSEVFNGESVQEIVSPKKKIVLPTYFIELKLADKIYKAETNDIAEGLETFKPEIIKGAGILSLRKGNLKSELRLYPRQIRKLMVNKVLKLIIAKRLLTALK